MKNVIVTVTLGGLLFGCATKQPKEVAVQQDSIATVKPVIVSDRVRYDSDDPAIWINADDPARSLIIGTDKGGHTGDGGLFVFDLDGKLVAGKTIANIQRANNVDVAYDLKLNGKETDIAVVTERYTNSIRVFTVPGFEPVDGGGIPVFEGDSLRSPMGIALFTSADGNIYAIVSRKNGPSGSYLWQYLLYDDGKGSVKGKVVRKFGDYSSLNEIESIAVDNELGYVYYSDEGFGVRKFYAHPDSSSIGLAVIGATDFAEDNEGISVYKFPDGTGYILVSDQQANRFHVYPREGTRGNPHHHPLVKTIPVSTNESDGSDVTSIPLPGFPHGLFIAMSDDKTFQYYRWEDLAGNELRKAE